MAGWTGFLGAAREPANLLKSAHDLLFQIWNTVLSESVPHARTCDDWLLGFLKNSSVKVIAKR